jgi:hypothetical protein
MDNYLGSQIGVIVFYEGGRLVIPSYHQATAFDLEGNLIKDFNQGGNHFANFLSAIEHRDPGRLNADILEGHLSSALCHTGAMSHQLGRTASAQEILDTVSGDERFLESVQRMLAHVAANEVDLAETPLILGRELRFATESEHALDNPLAEKALKRDYRPGFEVPEFAEVGTASPAG